MVGNAEKKGELSFEGQTADASVSPEGVKEIMEDDQIAGILLFQEVYGKKSTDEAKSEKTTPSAAIVDQRSQMENRPSWFLLASVGSFHAFLCSVICMISPRCMLALSLFSNSTSISSNP